MSVIEEIKNNHYKKVVEDYQGGIPVSTISKEIGKTIWAINEFLKKYDIKKDDFQIFVDKANKKHNNKYRYFREDYINMAKSVRIECPIHGIFKQSPTYHLTKNGGCPTCSKEKLRNIEKEKFINGSKKIHNNKYDYSLVEYINNETKVKIICPIHGEFLKTPVDHQCGEHGCPSCSMVYYNEKTFIELVNTNYNYDCSQVKYINGHTSVKLICSKHGIFEQTPDYISRGRGCPRCSEHIFNTKRFIEMANKIHNNKYDYSKSKYVHSHKKVIIICPIHGKFVQTPSNHIYAKKSGCPHCNISKGEDKIMNYLTEHNIVFEHEISVDKLFPNKHDENKYLSFDFYLPKQNLLIEYDGQHHYEPIEYFGGKKQLKRVRKKDEIKNKIVEVEDINILRIPYWKYNDIENILNNNI